MPGISIHVVDVSRGVVAQGMNVELHAIAKDGEPTLVAYGAIGAHGTLDKHQPRLTWSTGIYL